ncbi:hypothetical protein [Rhizobium sp. Leaf383]|uniref:hypothetical protein n=1 Tax=Rhizobium sp. Leaf383 TaxID=1736357 RepID=UPI0012E3A37D|nr:hypothetical protein [Rhizobium sp. Leaf383]
MEYNVPKLLKGLPEDNELVRMTYREDAPMLLRNKQSTEDRAKMILSCKSLRWAGEREWSLFRPERGRADYRETGTVTGVYIGSRISDFHEKIIRTEMFKAKIKVLKMKVDVYALGFDGPRLRKKIGPS